MLVNTSRRRAPGIAWAITAGLLYGAVGIGTSAPAFADDSGRGPSAGDIDAPGTDGAGNDSGPRRHGRENRATPSGNTGAGGSAGGGAWHPGDPCPWWPVPRPVPPPAPISGGNNNSGLIAAAPIVAVIPVPVFGAEAEPRFDIDALADDAPAVAAPAAVAPAAGYPAAAAPLPRPVTRLATAPAAAPLPARVAALSPPAAPAKCVAAKALVASVPLFSALPALKPNQPTHSNPVPIRLSTTLCGSMG
ncbi:MAG: hypothetical protein WCP30_16570, partial [Mycobacteriaceae bacterium]